MPSIRIEEIDATTGGGSSGVVDIAYVPGFRAATTLKKAWPTLKDGTSDTKNAAPLNEPILCETTAEFERYFGKVPIKGDVTYGSISNLIDTSAKVTATEYFTTVDLSYIYAKELISLGIPVLYEALAEGDTLTASMIETLYDTLSDGVDGPFNRLKEKGEFDVKYLTTGGYPNWNSKSPDTRKVIATPSNVTFTGITITDETLAKNAILAEPNKELKCTVTITPPGEDETDPTIDWDSKLPAGVKVEETLLTSMNGDDYIFNGMTITFKIEGNEASSNVIPKLMRDCAKDRGDCVAFIDHFNSSSRDLVGTDSFYNDIVSSFLDSGEGSTVNSFVTAFTPWVNITTVSMDKENSGNYFMPGSYAYLSALGQSIQTNANWLAVAGAARGSIPNLDGKKPFNLEKKLTNTIAEKEYQNRDGVSINAITNINPFGYRIWGNRTLKNNSFEGDLTATSFLNIRNLVSDVKKVVYQACKKHTFEQNNDLLWTNFKAYIEPTLERMRTGAGISGYKIIKGTTTEKAKLVATIKLFPIYAVEDFEVTVVMEDDEISVN